MREKPVVRARVIAHYLEHSMREAFAAEKMKAKMDKEAAPPNAAGVSDFFRYRQGGGAA